MVNEVVKEMILYFCNDVKRINHALKVYGFVKSIMSKETLSEEEQLIIELSAILHDIGIIEAEKKHNSSAGKYQELEGPSIARSILEKLNVDKNITQRVCYLVGNHHSYSKIDNKDFQILVEADFIVNIYEDNMTIDMINTIKNKYFKTEVGRSILNSMYL